MSVEPVASFYMEGDAMELLWRDVASLPESGDLFLASGNSQKLEAEKATLKEENERLKLRLDKQMELSRVLADGNASLFETADALKARVAELEGDFKLIDLALMARKAVREGFTSIPAEINSAEEFIAWVRKDPANEA